MYYVLKYLISLLLLILGKLVVSSHKEVYVAICVN
nr:MAG TPA: hypothetical protein [Caudoviricetes sp.]DAW87800.1 MAG TPA: hypothetical protein [Caudoviricetes sp.]